jgi:hypothetical protein
MKRVLLAGLLAVLVSAALGTGSARAQAGTGLYYVPVPQYGVGQRQLLSPYLNLVNPGFTGGVTTPGATANFLAPLNYYNLTLPEQQRRANQQNIYNQLDLIERGAVPAPAAPGQDEISELTRPISATGHPTFFNTTGGYFANQRAGTGAYNRLGQQQRQQQPRMR